MILVILGWAALNILWAFCLGRITRDSDRDAQKLLRRREEHR